MRITPAVHSVSIVMVGNLNPAIISPHWLARHEAIPMDMADASEINVIHPEITAFKSGWCSVHIDRSRFQVQTNEAPFVRLCDLATKVFGELLPNTPMTALGINTSVSFGAPSLKARDAFGVRLSPPENWGDWGRGIAEAIQSGDGKKPHGGMASVTMQQRPLDDRDDGHLNVKVEPAPKLPDHTGISIEVNDHYVIIESGEAKSDGLSYARLLDKRFAKSLERADSIIDQLMGLVR